MATANASKQMAGGVAVVKKGRRGKKHSKAMSGGGRGKKRASVAAVRMTRY